jgi:hypothetical protein
MSIVAGCGRLVPVNTGQLLNGRYLLAERLGEGGMSVVWRAHDRVLDRDVAVKVLASKLAADPVWRRRIRLEARAAARLSHPNVTGVYDYGETDGDAPFVVMELLRGPSLADVLRDGPLPIAAALRVCAEVATGLAAAHAQNLVHRDVKPANVMLTAEAAKLLDFGIVGFAGVPDRAGGPQIFGTPAYLAPERVTSGDVTPASDVYAFGVLLFRCLTGRLPWDSMTAEEMVLAHVTVAPQPLPARPGLPPDVRELFASCLAKNPADRPAAAVVAARLARAAGIVPRDSVVRHEAAPASPGPDDPGATTEMHAPPGQRRRVLIGIGALVATAAALVAVALNRPITAPRAGGEAARAPWASSTGPATGTASAPSPSVPPETAAASAAGIATASRGAGEDEQAQDEDDQSDPGSQGGGVTNLATDGGVIVAICAGKKVDVQLVVPAPGVLVVRADLGEHTKAHVEFGRDGQRLRYVVTCPAGAPAAIAA